MGKRSRRENKAALTMTVAIGLGCGVVLETGFSKSSAAAAPRTDDGMAVAVLPALQECRQERDPEERLRCYDDVAARNAPPTYAGKLGYTTEPFTLKRPHILRFRSQGVIFVLYVLDDQGHVVQNLHIGGGGEDSYLIDKPGTYSLQIDGSARWQIWLDPA